MNRQDFRFFHRMRVRWAEVDMQKIVFNAHYLMYFDTAVADYWRAVALPYEEAMHQLGGDLVIGLAPAEGFAVAFPEGEEFRQQAVDVEASVGRDDDKAEFEFVEKCA